MTEHSGTPQQRNFGDALRSAYAVPDEQLPFAQITAAADRIHAAVYEDELTGQKNRRAAFAALDANFRRGDDVRVYAFDVNRIKEANDVMGHQAGDAIIRTVGQKLHDVFNREGEVVARTGGDEFIVISPKIWAENEQRDEYSIVDPQLSPDPDALRNANDVQTVRVNADLEAAFRGTDYEGLGVSVSGGFADRQPFDTPETLLARADITMILGKQTGKINNSLDQIRNLTDLHELDAAMGVMRAHQNRIEDHVLQAAERKRAELQVGLDPNLKL
ncbi:MAG: GGDEF domain-containing protein [Candidatus Saccharibacteria bacterium]|nr:GGDEF domain-containing protein [Candidatus Saccharibacteria bacterium]